MKIVQFGNTDYRLLKKFVKFPWRLYKDDPAYVPPLNMDMLGNRFLGVVGFLTDKHPFHQHADVTYFLAYRGDEIVGRIGGCIDHLYNRQNQRNAVIFGFFEVVEDFEVARALLDAVARWGAEKGADQLVGPMSFSTNQTIGVQLDAYGTLPYFETACNPPYYAEFMSRYGLEKGMDVIAQVLSLSERDVYRKGLERFEKEAAEAIKEHGYTYRPIDLKNVERDKEFMREVYNDAWKDNWGAVSFTHEEFDLVTEQFRAVCDPDTTLLAFVGDEPVALFVIMPDVYDCIKIRNRFIDRFDLVRLFRLFWNRRRTRRARVILLGIKEKYRKNGLRPLLVSEGLKKVIAKKQFEYLEAGWLLETNTRIIRTGETFNAKRYKTWRIYEKVL